ncbi:MAG: hypothetical protein V9E96_04025 [Chitinophagaceae bacterium]|jgi:hypothetical protein|nr:hypothetical protein [Chitinophagaceae bacterium]MBP9740036.1 hypothetical protein [Chitinophagaceae bacterium]
MNKIKIAFTVLFLFILNVWVKAQDVAVNTNAISKEERSEQSIYVVMAVAITIVLGLLLYLISLDRKISKIEKGKL